LAAYPITHYLETKYFRSKI